MAEDQVKGGGVLRAFKSIVACVALLIVGGLIAAVSTFASSLFAIAAGIAGAVAYFRPLPKLWLYGKASAVTFVMIALLSLAASFTIRGENRAKEMAALRESNPKEYLAKIKESDLRLYRIEVATLDPEAYEAMMAENKVAEEKAEAARVIADKALAEANKVKVAAVVEELKAVPESDLETNAAKYKELVALVPSNKAFADKVRYYTGKQVEQRDIELHPERHLEMEFSWVKGGFDHVMLAKFSFTNQTSFDMKDVTVRCNLIAASGTQIGKVEGTVLQRVPAGKTIHVQKFNMGFINSQTDNVSCRVFDVKRF